MVTTREIREVWMAKKLLVDGRQLCAYIQDNDTNPVVIADVRTNERTGAMEVLVGSVWHTVIYVMVV